MSKPSRQDQLRALVEEEVNRAMKPYRDLGLSADVLDELEHLLRFALVNHPTPQGLFRVLLDDPSLVKSDEVDTSGLDEALKKDEEA